MLSKYAHSVISNAHDAFICIDSNDLIQDWNPSAEKLLGWKKEEVLNKKLIDYLIPDRFKSQYSTSIKYFMQTGQGDFLNRLLQLQAKTKWGTEVSVEVTIADVATEVGVTFHTFLRDVSARRIAEEAAKEIEDLYENAPCGYHSIDAEGVLQKMNKTELNWLGYTKEEVVGKKSLLDLVAPHHHHIFFQNFPTFKLGGKPQDYEFDMVRKDGSTFPALVRATAILDANGKYLNSRSMTLDLTERKRMELVNRIREDSEYFARMTSHDLREPIRNITMFADLIMRDHRSCLDEPSQLYLGYIRDGAKRLMAMVESLSEFAAQTEAVSPPTAVNLNQLVEEVTSTLSVQIQENHAVIHTQPLPEVFVQRGNLFHVFQNLISNSLKYRSSAPPVIEISCKSLARDWEINIKDNGVGFDQRYSDVIFSPFKRLDNKTNVKGFGIGLAICKRLISKLGGRIWANSRPGEGSCFSFTLPKKETIQNQLDAVG